MLSQSFQHITNNQPLSRPKPGILNSMPTNNTGNKLNIDNLRKNIPTNNTDYLTSSHPNKQLFLDEIFSHQAIPRIHSDRNNHRWNVGPFYNTQSPD